MPRSETKQQASRKEKKQTTGEKVIKKKPTTSTTPAATRRSHRLAHIPIDIDDEPPQICTKPGKTMRKRSPPKELAPSAQDPTLPVYFWKIGETYGYLSQWYASPFTDIIVLPSGTTTHTFANAEQYMMYRKALLFAPSSPVTTEILTVSNPRTLKSLGRKVPNFDQKVWEKHRLDIVRRGNLMKFWQDEELRKKLLSTGEREIVEASPMDRIWGVGFAAENAEKWRGSGKWGMNLLGMACMDVREKIRALEKEGGRPSESVKVEVQVDSGEEK